MPTTTTNINLTRTPNTHPPIYTLSVGSAPLIEAYITSKGEKIKINKIEKSEFERKGWITGEPGVPFSIHLNLKRSPPQSTTIPTTTTNNNDPTHHGVGREPRYDPKSLPWVSHTTSFPDYEITIYIDDKLVAVRETDGEESFCFMGGANGLNGKKHEGRTGGKGKVGGGGERAEVDVHWVWVGDGALGRPVFGIGAGAEGKEKNEMKATPLGISTKANANINNNAEPNAHSSTSASGFNSTSKTSPSTSSDSAKAVPVNVIQSSPSTIRIEVVRIHRNNFVRREVVTVRKEVVGRIGKSVGAGGPTGSGSGGSGTGYTKLHPVLPDPISNLHRYQSRHSNKLLLTYPNHQYHPEDLGKVPFARFEFVYGCEGTNKGTDGKGSSMGLGLGEQVGKSGSGMSGSGTDKEASGSSSSILSVTHSLKSTSSIGKIPALALGKLGSGATSSDHRTDVAGSGGKTREAMFGGLQPVDGVDQMIITNASATNLVPRGVKRAHDHDQVGNHDGDSSTGSTFTVKAQGTTTPGPRGTKRALDADRVVDGSGNGTEFEMPARDWPDVLNATMREEHRRKVRKLIEDLEGPEEKI